MKIFLRASFKLRKRFFLKFPPGFGWEFLKLRHQDPDGRGRLATRALQLPLTLELSRALAGNVTTVLPLFL